MALDVGDAILSFVSDTTQIDQVFARLPDQADKAMSACADSVDQVGDSLKGLEFELDATGSNAAYAGGEIKESMEKAADAAKDAGEKINYSFREARGGIALVGEEFGIHLPRELMVLLAHIPMVGAAFSVMLPAIGVVAAIKLIGDLIEKHEKLAEAQRHEAEGAEVLAAKQADMVLALKDANLRIEDQIRKLEGRPEQNQLAIALNEVKIAADNLAMSFVGDFAKMDVELEKQTGFWKTLESNALAALAAAVPELVAAKWIKSSQDQVAANSLIQTSIEQVTSAQQHFAEASRKLADIDPKKNADE